jgi:hypothetical protein
VTDQQLWSAASAAVRAEYAALPPRLREQLAGLLKEIGSLKEAAASRVDSGELCTACGGICCGFGKHHFSVVDLLGYLVAGAQLFEPAFDNPLCPYHTGRGCMMAAALRPFNCIIFICEQLDAGLDDAVRRELAAMEQQLRHLYGRIEELLGNRFENGLLITYERGLSSGEPLFRY